MPNSSKKVWKKIARKAALTQLIADNVCFLMMVFEYSKALFIYIKDDASLLYLINNYQLTYFTKGI